MDADEIIAAAVSAMTRKMDEACYFSLTGSTASATAPAFEDQKPFDVDRLLRDWPSMMASARRHAVVLEVSALHPGPMIKNASPCDGTRIECSWRQAADVHKFWPLKLARVLSPDVAEFVPVSSVFPEYTTRTLPMPPYDMPPDS